nr:immunoglobulin light chain junction region [Macaca mulatta]MOW12684.1 immunoglobulin light chain junction region [Macaca mulatta]
CQKYSNSPFTF